MFKFELGIKVKDKVSEVEGIIMSRTEHLNGCIQYAVMPKAKKGATEIPSWNIDEAQLVKIGKKVKKIKKSKSGGAMSKVITQ